MGMLRKMDYTGDSIVAEWDKADPRSTEAAKALFDAFLVERRTMYERRPGQDAVLLREFNPDAEEIVARGRYAGG